MDMKSLIHHQQPERAVSAPQSAAMSMPGLPGLRAQFPAMRLPLLRPPVDMASSSSSSSSAPSGPSASTSADARRSPPLAPLRFIIPSSSSASSSVSYASSSAAMHGSSALSYGHEMDAARTLYNTQSASVGADTCGVDAYSRDRAAIRPSPPSSRSASPSSAYSIKTEDGQDLAGTSAGTKLKQTPTANGTKKATSKRSRQPKMTNRSTKSKARPGLRKGKWTDEESRYATQLTNYFKEGLLPIERGTMLRLYLSQKLNCEPMRITKKFTGGECIGKQVFRPCSPTPESRVRMMHAQLELVTLEAAFIKRLKENREEAPAAIEELEANAASAALASAASDLNGAAGFEQTRRFRREIANSTDEGSYAANGDGDVDDASAVGLLLDFFYKANRNDKENDSKKATASMSTTAPASPVKTEPVAEPEDADDKDPLVNSPTKRIRALSLSNFVNDPAASKRSRVGSFTVCA